MEKLNYYLVVVVIYFAVSVWLRLPAKMAIMVGLMLFTLATIIYAATMSELSNKFAIVAFYFLAAGVFLYLIEHLREYRRKGSGDKKDRD